MNRMMLVVVALLLGGCSTGLKLQVQSNPPGASVYQAGQLVGQTPVNLTYTDPKYLERFKAGQCVQTMPLTIVWVSGAKQESAVNLCPNIGWSQVYTANRGYGPGMDVDANYALQLQRNSIMQQQASQQAYQTYLQQQQLNTQQQQLQQQQMQNLYRPSVNCTSRAYGNTVNTNCY